MFFFLFALNTTASLADSNGNLLSAAEDGDLMLAEGALARGADVNAKKNRCQKESVSKLEL